MKEQLIQLTEMVAILHPEYADTLHALQKECQYFSHQVAGDSLISAIINICQSPVMIEYPPETRQEVEHLLLDEIRPGVIH